MRMGWSANHNGPGTSVRWQSLVYQDEGIPFLRIIEQFYDDGLKSWKRQHWNYTHGSDRMLALGQDRTSCLEHHWCIHRQSALVPSGFGEGNVSQHVAIIRLTVLNCANSSHLSLISPSYRS